jgi:hypothetical protein
MLHVEGFLHINEEVKDGAYERICSSHCKSWLGLRKSTIGCSVHRVNCNPHTEFFTGTISHGQGVGGPNHTTAKKLWYSSSVLAFYAPMMLNAPYCT